MEIKIKNNNKREEEEKEGTGLETERKEQKNSEEIAKITITKSSESKLMMLLQEANEGFENGRVNRQSLASWIIERVCNDCEDGLVEDIRNDHIDRFMMLEAILRQGRSDGKLPSDIDVLLNARANQGVSSRTKARKNLTKKYINDVVQREAVKENLNGTEGIQTD